MRLLLFALMLAGLVMSTSLPQAFDSRGLAFAGAYVFSQVGRCLFMLWSVRRHHRNNFRNFQRITAWLMLSGVFWIAGAFVEHEQRFALWAIALAIEYDFAGVRLLDAGPRQIGDHRLGCRGRSHGRALRPVRHHCARRIDSGHRRHLRQDGMDRAGRSPPSSSRLPAASRCGGSISISVPSAAAI